MNAVESANIHFTLHYTTLHYTTQGDTTQGGTTQGGTTQGHPTTISLIAVNDNHLGEIDCSQSLRCGTICKSSVCCIILRYKE